MEKKQVNILQEIDLNEIIKSSIKNDPNLKQLDEAFHAEEKKFNQVSDLISQKTKSSHEALYKNYVETFNKISIVVDSVDRNSANSNNSDYRSAKLDETYNLNGMWLHELYFANCFSPSSEIYADSMSYIRLQRDFGSFANWQKDFIAAALSCGQGWVITGYHLFLKKYVTTIVSCNSQDVMVGLLPIIVVDMHEHSYYRDYATDKMSYIISQMKELNWNVIEDRIRKSEAINEAIK